MDKKLLARVSAILLLTACNLFRFTESPPAGTSAVPPTAQPATITVAPPTEPPTGTAPEEPKLQFIAYVSSDQQLLVTNVTGNTAGGTTQYTAPGQSDKVADLVWSPSGEFVAFTSAATGDPHVAYIYAQGASTPTDLGAGSNPAWSPDSQSIAYIGGTYPNENIFITGIDNPAPKQLTFENNHAWGRPAFTPDGQALIVATADRMDMGASGNTTYILERLALDGSGTRAPLPGAGQMGGMRLPYDLRFSPDGTRLAFSASSHLSACASPGAYYVMNPDGSSGQELLSPSLKQSVNFSQERYPVGFSYAWSTDSKALIATGTVADCKMNSPNFGQNVAGPQMSLLGLDGSERTIIPGMFWNPSMDRTGKLIAAAHYQNVQFENPVIEIYSAETSQLLLSLGPGSYPQLQP